MGLLLLGVPSVALRAIVRGIGEVQMIAGRPDVQGWRTEWRVRAATCFEWHIYCRLAINCTEPFN
jgi:hypothetical protein